MAQQPETSDAFWRRVLVDGHQLLRSELRLFRYLPGPPRCKVCHSPFGGIGGKLVGLFGYTPSRKNPKVCALCCERLHKGGAEVDIAVLFADIRGSTAIAEHMEPSAYAALLDRFYRVATEVLVRHDAIVDKLLGDEVMALFIPGICGANYKRLAAQAAVALLDAVGYRAGAKVWMPMGAAVNSGLSYVGNVGGEGTVDFTALGDTVNVASRLASVAAAGEVLLSQGVFAAVADEFPAQEGRTMLLRGREVPFSVRVLRRPGAIAPSS